jgi:hypothetical protein
VRGDGPYVLLMIAYPIALALALLMWPAVVLWIFLTGIPFAAAVWFAEARKGRTDAGEGASGFPWFRFFLVATTFAWPYVTVSIASWLRSRRSR